MMSESNEMANGGDHADGTPSKSGTPQSRSGWDGKLRVNKQAVLANPEALSDPEYSDEDAPPPEEIEADEGEVISTLIECKQANSSRPSGW